MELRFKPWAWSKTCSLVASFCFTKNKKKVTQVQRLSSLLESRGKMKRKLFIFSIPIWRLTPSVRLGKLPRLYCFFFYNCFFFYHLAFLSYWTTGPLSTFSLLVKKREKESIELQVFYFVTVIEIFLGIKPAELYFKKGLLGITKYIIYVKLRACYLQIFPKTNAYDVSRILFILNWNASIFYLLQH